MLPMDKNKVSLGLKKIVVMLAKATRKLEG